MYTVAHPEHVESVCCMCDGHLPIRLLTHQRSHPSRFTERAYCFHWPQDSENPTHAEAVSQEFSATTENEAGLHIDEFRGCESFDWGTQVRE
jgi:hypothetical protein